MASVKIEPELDDMLMRWPSQDMHDDDFENIIEKIEHPHIDQVWIGGNVEEIENHDEETKGAENHDDIEEDVKKSLEPSSKVIMLHREYASKFNGYFHKSEPRVYDLFNNGKLISFSKIDGTIKETILLTQVGLITQKGPKVKLHLEDPKLKGKDNRPYGHFDLKHIIVCKNIEAATQFKRMIYEQTVHLHFGDE